MTTGPQAHANAQTIAFQHIEYEYRQLMACRHLVAAQRGDSLVVNLRASGSDDATAEASLCQLRICIRNAILESFLIHARNLIDFLAADKKKKDDITCDHFTLDGKPTPPAVGQRIRRAIDKRLAHLTYTRLRVARAEKAWDVEGIASKIDEAYQRFLVAAGRTERRAAPLTGLHLPGDPYRTD